MDMVDKGDGRRRVPVRVLVVDDEPDVLQALGDLVEDLGNMRVERAGSMARAVGLLRAHDYDLVLADERLGDGRGSELLRWVGLRSPSTALVLVSAHDDFAALVDAVNAARIHQFVRKPWDPPELQARLRALLEEQAVLAQRLRAFARALVARDAEAPELAERSWPPS